ncbi:hypothetical protein BDV95DRAFT_611936 [Massariosphaeria phaeospora]|uniref:Uncharacterized protein n=1 Tax=Massariosphaeria phaeospora TaxID=100035 RepID=A0A7C8M2B4_9PLEO|nr:hypothetical protein BDV95DRAFT_611936 [Massariosphaeria phaeospora]
MDCKEAEEPILNADKINGGQPIYTRERLLEVFNEDPHHEILNYGELGNRSEYDLRKSRFKSTIPKEEQDDFRRDFQGLLDNWPQEPAFERIYQKLRQSVAINPPALNLLILGLPSPVEGTYFQDGPPQFMMTSHIVANIVWLVHTRFGGKIKPKVFLDYSSFNKEKDMTVDNLQYVRQHLGFSNNGWNTFQFSPLGHLLAAACNHHNIVVMFMPENPIRQMMADILLHNTTDKLPQMIICPPWDINITRKDSGSGGDKTSTRVKQLLGRYEQHPFTDADTKDTVIGKLRLYIIKESTTPKETTPAPSTGATPAQSPEGTPLPEFFNEAFDYIAHMASHSPTPEPEVAGFPGVDVTPLYVPPNPNP